MALAFDPQHCRSDAPASHLRLVHSDDWYDHDIVEVAPERPVSVRSVLVIAIFVFGYLGLLRLNTGGPPATAGGGGASPQGAAVASAAPGDYTYVVQPGDTLWAIAEQIAPNSDPRPVVDRLEAVNGGNLLGIGQRLVIPSDLVSSKGATNLGLVDEGSR